MNPITLLKVNKQNTQQDVFASQIVSFFVQSQ
jgi:hypothetical protein